MLILLHRLFLFQENMPWSSLHCGNDPGKHNSVLTFDKPVLSLNTFYTWLRKTKLKMPLQEQEHFPEKLFPLSDIVYRILHCIMFCLQYIGDCCVLLACFIQ